MQPIASPEDGKPFRPPHPLAVALIERLRGTHLPVLDFATGSGRNSAALEAAGFRVVRIDDATAASASPFPGLRGPFAGIVSTHGLLHGTSATVAANLAAIAGILGPGCILYATFGSVRDARFGIGERLDDSTYALLDGDEAGVPHAFFDRDALASLLQRHFTIESLEECTVDEVAGKWAHHERPLAHAVHWFALAARSR